MGAVDPSSTGVIRRPRLMMEVLRAALGAVLSFVGLVLLGRQAIYYVETAHWPASSLLDLLKSPTVRLTLPGELVSWIERPEFLHGLQAPTASLLDIVPAALFFLGVGGSLLWRALR